MIDSWGKVEELVKRDARHRNGWSINSLSMQDILEHVCQELHELEASPDDMDEMADLFGCLIHYAIKKKWFLHQIDEALVGKLNARFDSKAVDDKIKELEAEVSELKQRLKEIEDEAADYAAEKDLLEP